MPNFMLLENKSATFKLLIIGFPQILSLLIKHKHQLLPQTVLQSCGNMTINMWLFLLEFKSIKIK